MRMNHLAVRIAGLMTFLLLITVIVLSENPTSKSPTAKPAATEAPSSTSSSAIAESSQQIKTVPELTQITLVSRTLPQNRDKDKDKDRDKDRDKDKDKDKDTDKDTENYSVLYEIPVLLVSSKAKEDAPDDESVIEFKGTAEILEMEFTRSSNTSPFRLAVAEENPGSSGPSLQSSFWQAAMVAALHESDNLSGVRVTFTVPSNIDGPSAGGITSLTLLSAMNRKELPKDFTFTGSILPDGTIGHVGGMVEKLRATKELAASRGFNGDSPLPFRMLIPAGIRFAEDKTTFELIDLQELATQFNITLIPVRNLKAAYEKVHRLPEGSEAGTDELIAKVPKALEAILLKDSLKSLEDGNAIWREIPEDEQKELYVTFNSYAARRALRRGQFCYAFEQATIFGEYLKVRGTNEAYFNDIFETRTEKLFEVIEEEIKQVMTNARTPESILDSLAEELPPIASQLFFDILQFYCVEQQIEITNFVLQEKIRQIIDMEDDELSGGQTREGLVRYTVYWVKYRQLLWARSAQRRNELHALGNRQAETLSAIDVDLERAQQVEQFFYTAFRSIQTTLETEVINQRAKKESQPVDEMYSYVFRQDSTLSKRSPIYAKAFQFHSDLEEEDNPESLLFKTTFSAHLYAGLVAELSGVVVRWSELGIYFNSDDEAIYFEHSLLSQLIREARKNSIEKMNQCHAKGIPCISSIWMFETAEIGRDDTSIDKVDVLLNYWKASLQAQALQMLFQSKK